MEPEIVAYTNSFHILKLLPFEDELLGTFRWNSAITNFFAGFQGAHLFTPKIEKFVIDNEGSLVIRLLGATGFIDCEILFSLPLVF